jgi:hypothetical protein
LTFAFAVAACLMGEVRSGPGWKTALLVILAALSMRWAGGLGKGNDE